MTKEMCLEPEGSFKLSFDTTKQNLVSVPPLEEFVSISQKSERALLPSIAAFPQQELYPGTRDFGPVLVVFPPQEPGST